MDHQPFENWLFSEGDLEPQEKKALNEHLKDCSTCDSLTQAWNAIESEIHASPVLAPPAGFSSRWRERLYEKRIQQQRKIVWWSILGCFLAGAAIWIQLNGEFLSSITLDRVISWVLYQVSLTVVSMTRAPEILRALNQLVPAAIPITLWILAATSFCILTLIWVFSLWRIMIPKGLKA